MLIPQSEVKGILQDPRYLLQSYVVNGHFHTTIMDRETGLSSICIKYNSYYLSIQTALSELLEKIQEHKEHPGRISQ
jgi:hypothetical protein